MCDVYVSPYLKVAQMTSGTLAYSFGLGESSGLRLRIGNAQSCLRTVGECSCLSAMPTPSAAKSRICLTDDTRRRQCANARIRIAGG